MSEELSEALEACPFCGSPAELGIVTQGGEANPDFGGHFIQCTNVQCHGCMGLRFACGDDPRPALIDAWNRRAALRASTDAAAELSYAGEGIVRLLNWDESDNRCQQASTGFGWYTVQTMAGYGLDCWRASWSSVGSWSKDCDTIEGAKSAAQADFESRIRKWLVPRPAPAEPVGLREDQRRRRETLIERIGTFADGLSAKPLPGVQGDVAYDLLRQAAAQISSDNLALSTLTRTDEASAEGEGDWWRPANT